MQDLTEHARDVDLDVALQQTYERHNELARARDRKRRLAFGGGVAAVVVLAVAALPVFLATDDDGTVGVADDGSDVAPVEVAPQVIERWTIDEQIEAGVQVDFDLSAEGDVWIMTRKPETVVDFEKVESGGAVVLGGAPVLERGVDVESIEGTAASQSVRLHFACVGGESQVQQVRYRVDEGVLFVRGDVMGSAGAPCEAGEHATAVDLPLPETLDDGLPFVVDPSL